MVKSASVRMAVLLSALAGTVVSIAMPGQEEGIAEAYAPRPRASAVVPVQITPVAPVPSALMPAAESDPFAARSWGSPPPGAQPLAAPTTITVAAAEATASQSEPEPPKPPPLPFKFAGRFSDGTQAYVYLSSGDTAHVVRTGDIVGGTHKVVSIEARLMLFEHLPTGLKQELYLPDPDQ